MKRIFTDRERLVAKKRMYRKASAIGTKTTVIGKSKTLPLITLMKRIFTDRERLVRKQENVPESVCEWDEDGCDREDQKLTADNADRTDFH